MNAVWISVHEYKDTYVRVHTRMQTRTRVPLSRIRSTVSEQILASLRWSFTLDVRLWCLRTYPLNLL